MVVNWVKNLAEKDESLMNHAIIQFKSRILENQKLKLIQGVITSTSHKYDKYLTIGLIVCIIPSFWMQFGAHISPEYIKYDYAPDFAANWAISEWLISFGGGFVRRGITGELVRILSELFQLSPNFIIVALTAQIFALVLAWTIYVCRKKYPFYVIISPLLLGAPVFSGYLVRKDMLIALVFICSLVLIVSNYNKIIKFILVNILCTFAMLAHEMFFFIGLPLLIVCYSLFEYKKKFSINSILFFFLPICLMLVVALFRGTEEIGLAIVEQWNELNSRISPSYCCIDELDTAIEALTNDIIWHMSLNVSYWNKYVYGILWTPAIWVCIWLVYYVFLTKFIETYDSSMKQAFLSYYFFQTVCAIPLFLLAWDYGRWILLIAFTSFIASYIMNGNERVPFFEKYTKISVWKGQMQLWHKVAITFLFGIPHIWDSLVFQLRVLPLVDLLLVFF